MANDTPPQGATFCDGPEFIYTAELDLKDDGTLSGIGQSRMGSLGGFTGWQTSVLNLTIQTGGTQVGSSNDLATAIDGFPATINSGSFQAVDGATYTVSPLCQYQ